MIVKLSLLASKDKVRLSVLVVDCDGESSQEVIVCHYKSLVDTNKVIVKQLLYLLRQGELYFFISMVDCDGESSRKLLSAITKVS